MFVRNYLTDEDYELVVVCDVCGLPYEEGDDEDVTHSYHIHHNCYWNLEIHAPDSEETLESLGFKEYNEQS